MKPYPTYWNSGVEWLGDVPAHWEVRRLKGWLGVNERVLSEETDPEYRFDYLDIGSVETGRLAEEPTRIRFEDSPSRARRVVRCGDTIVSTVRTYLKAVWHARDAGADLIASTGFAVLTARGDAIPGFVSYCCQSDSFTNRVTAESVGIAYPAIAESKLATLKVCVPPTSEQAAIARFLDHATSHIDRYIRAKSKLIALLEEQKQAIIDEVVTGRIDVRTGRSYASYKPSGVEWLPIVPSHWDTRRSKRVFRPRQELAKRDDIQLSATQAYGVIAQAIYEKRIGRKVVRVSQHLDKRRHVEVDDFVISMRSFQGGLERAWARGCIRSSYVVLRPVTELAIGYFELLFKSDSYINALRSTANFIRDGQDLNFDNFCGVDLPFPPLDEQRRIAEVVHNTWVEKASDLITKTRRQIEVLTECRARLIADVVTGKLDVRGTAPALPRQADMTVADLAET